MVCLYASDYGPPDPAFDPFADNGRLLKGFEPHVHELATARNLAQLQAMERHLQRGEEVVWCDQGYGWAYQQPVNDFFIFAVIAVVLPYVALRLLPRIGGRLRRSQPARRIDFATLGPAPLDHTGDPS
jgi:hypothetical protein